MIQYTYILYTLYMIISIMYNVCNIQSENDKKMKKFKIAKIGCFYVSQNSEHFIFSEKKVHFSVIKRPFFPLKAKKILSEDQMYKVVSRQYYIVSGHAISGFISQHATWGTELLASSCICFLGFTTMCSIYYTRYT